MVRCQKYKKKPKSSRASVYASDRIKNFRARTIHPIEQQQRNAAEPNRMYDIFTSTTSDPLLRKLKPTAVANMLNKKIESAKAPKMKQNISARSFITV